MGCEGPWGGLTGEERGEGSLCSEDHRESSVPRRPWWGGASEARTLALGGKDLREPRSWEDRGGRAEGAFAPFSHPALPSGSCGFLYALVYLTLVSSINLARSTLLLVNIY